MVEQPAAERAAAEQGGEAGQAAELDLTNAHLPSLAEVPGLTQQLTVSAAARPQPAAACRAQRRLPASAAAAATWAHAPRVFPQQLRLHHRRPPSSPVLLLPSPATHASHAGAHPPPSIQSLDLTANRLRSLEPCLLALTGLRRLCLRQNLVSQPAEVEALACAPGAWVGGGGGLVGWLAAQRLRCSMGARGRHACMPGLCQLGRACGFALPPSPATLSCPSASPTPAAGQCSSRWMCGTTS